MKETGLKQLLSKFYILTCIPVFQTYLYFGNPFKIVSYLYLCNFLFLARFGTFGAIIEYSCDKKISERSTIGAAMVIGVPSGVTLKLK